MDAKHWKWSKNIEKKYMEGSKSRVSGEGGQTKRWWNNIESHS